MSQDTERRHLWESMREDCIRKIKLRLYAVSRQYEPALGVDGRFFALKLNLDGNWWADESPASVASTLREFVDNEVASGLREGRNDDTWRTQDRQGGQRERFEIQANLNEHYKRVRNFSGRTSVQDKKYKSGDASGT